MFLWEKCVFSHRFLCIEFKWCTQTVVLFCVCPQGAYINKGKCSRILCKPYCHTGNVIHCLHILKPITVMIKALCTKHEEVLNQGLPTILPEEQNLND